MSRSIIDIADNDYTLPSPCLKCSRHKKGLDKNRCVRKCKRMKAYRNGKPYDNIPLGKLENIEEIKICEICKIEGRNRPAKIRGLCPSCYARWEFGRVLHPTLGEFALVNPRKNKKQEVKQAHTEQKTKKAGDNMPELSKTSYSATKAKGKTDERIRFRKN